MATIFTEGFDEYGAAGIFAPDLASVSLPQGGWTLEASIGGAGLVAIVPSLNGNAGYAVAVTSVVSGSGKSANISRTLPNNYARLIGGVRLLAQAGLPCWTGIAFGDGASTQLSLVILPTTGRLGLYLGGVTGPLLQTSLVSFAGNTEHYVEFDITFGVGGAGGWSVWLDGVVAMSGTGTTITTANAYSNVLQIIAFSASFLSSPSAIVTADDVYLFDSTTSFNNAVLLSNPVVLTDVAIAAAQTQFANDGNVVGNTSSVNSGTEGASANSLWLTPVTPEVACNAASIAVQLASPNNPTAQFQAVIYSDSAGAPGALLASGSVQTGFVTNELLVLPLASTPALTASTQYWIGFINNAAFSVRNASNIGVPYRYASNTFSGGPPATAPAMTNGAMPVLMYAICTGSAANWNSVAVLPPVGDASSISTSTAGLADLYTYPALPNNVTAVYTVSVSGNCRLDQSGARQFNLLAKSGATTGTGAYTNIGPTVTYAWYDSAFDTDPNTGLAWTKLAADNATYGIELVT